MVAGAWQSIRYHVNIIVSDVMVLAFFRRQRSFSDTATLKMNCSKRSSNSYRNESQTFFKVTVGVCKLFYTQE